MFLNFLKGVGVGILTILVLVILVALSSYLSIVLLTHIADGQYFNFVTYMASALIIFVILGFGVISTIFK